MKKNYVLGIIGAIIGGLVGCIPWIIAYVYMNMIFSLLAIIVAFGALYGYKIFKGKEDKKLPIIILVVSLLSITISTLVIIPLLLLANEGIDPSLENLKIIYSVSEFTSALMKDYIISIIFTLLGIGGTIASIRNKIKQEANVQTDTVNQTNSYSQPNELNQVNNYNPNTTDNNNTNENQQQ